MVSELESRVAYSCWVLDLLRQLAWVHKALQSITYHLSQEHIAILGQLDLYGTAVR